MVWALHGLNFREYPLFSYSGPVTIYPSLQLAHNHDCCAPGWRWPRSARGWKTRERHRGWGRRRGWGWYCCCEGCCLRGHGWRVGKIGAVCWWGKSPDAYCQDPMSGSAVEHDSEDWWREKKFTYHGLTLGVSAGELLLLSNTAVEQLTFVLRLPWARLWLIGTNKGNERCAEQHLHYPSRPVI